MHQTSDYMGLNGFIWWIGIVENRLDPLKIGRCQVRIYNWHTDNKNNISTENLPWAQPMMPVNGESTINLKEGDTVLGFFLDGNDGQFPVIMGFLPGIPEKPLPSQNGFTDPRKGDQLKSAPREPLSIDYITDGSGVKITEKQSASRNPNRPDESTFSRLATNEKIDKTIVEFKKKTLTKDVQTAEHSVKWSEPETKYDAVFPYNKVTQTESGHVFEMDDTPGKERIQLAHRTGTFVEIFPDGKRVQKVVKDDYEVILGDKDVVVAGNCNVTIQGKARLFVQNDYDLRVDGDYNIVVNGNMKTMVAKNITTTSDGINTTLAPIILLNPPMGLLSSAGLGNLSIASMALSSAVGLAAGVAVNSAMGAVAQTLGLDIAIAAAQDQIGNIVGGIFGGFPGADAFGVGF
jgi:hypothetical protein